MIEPRCWSGSRRTCRWCPGDRFPNLAAAAMRAAGCLQLTPHRAADPVLGIAARSATTIVRAHAEDRHAQARDPATDGGGTALSRPHVRWRRRQILPRLCRHLATARVSRGQDDLLAGGTVQGGVGRPLVAEGAWVT